MSFIRGNFCHLVKEYLAISGGNFCHLIVGISVILYRKFLSFS